MLSTDETNIDGTPSKKPSVSKVMSYQLTSPVAAPAEFAALLPGSTWLITVFRSKKTDALPVAGSTR